MPTHGTGSISSPIVISDDESEVINPPQRPESPPVYDRQRVFATVDTTDGDVHVIDPRPPSVHHQISRDSVRQLSDRVEPVPIVLKRKRDEGGFDNHGPSFPSSLIDLPLRPESKKARKRRKLIERFEAQLAMEHGHAMEEEYMTPLQDLSTQMPTWPGVGSAFNPSYLATHLAPRTHHAHGSTRRSTEQLTATSQSMPTHHQSMDKSNIISSSSLPSSSQATSFRGRLGGYTLQKPNPDVLPPRPQSLMYPIGPMAQRFSAQTTSVPDLTLPPKPRPRPAKKPTSIGVPHEPNSSNMTHGIFSCSKIQPNGQPYAPKPSRTLVMEQLPKSQRKRDVVRSWCKSVCGIFPVYAEVNCKGRALIEFPSAEMARRAFMSPQDVFGKSTVRAWWYRGDCVLGGKKAEIEEGEIDEGENALMSNAKKRKAQQQARKWEQKKNLNREGAARESLATQSVVGTSSGAITQSVLPFPATQSSDGPVPMAFAVEGSSVDHRDNGYQFYDYNSTYATETPRAGYNDNDDASIASSRRGSLIEPMTPNAHAEIECISEDMDVESPVASRQPSDLFNGYKGPATRRQQRMSPDPDISAQHKSRVSLSPTPRTVRRPQPSPPVTNLDCTPQESSGLLTAGPSYPPGPSPPPPPNVLSELPMKTPPTGPSFAKRSLLARHKDLEERIARTKMELTKAVDRTSRATPSEVVTISASAASSGTVTPVAPASVDVVDKAAIEDNLRRLVLESKRNKSQSSAVASLSPIPDSVSHSSSNPIDSSATVSNGSSVSTSSASSATSVGVEPTAPSQNALDDLAVSFITEAIQTIKSPPLLPLKPSHSTIRQELAAKQQRLEKQIAESKVLMAQLSAARTKQEKDRILALMREQSRVAEEGVKPTPAAAIRRDSEPENRAQCKLRWPETREDAGVFMISDDEDDG